MNANFWNSVILITSSDSEQIGDFGTGFVIHQDEQTTYLLTCAHVVFAVGGSDKVRVGGHPATVEALGDRYGCDLAVLAVKERLTKLPPLKLGVVGEKGRQFFGAGFYTDATKTRKLAQIKGKLGEMQIIESIKGDRTQAWNLQIDDDSEHHLKSGYSGSPVVDKISGYVLGVVAQQTDQGKGLAISIEALGKTWRSMPFDLLKTDNLSSEPEVDYTRLRDLLAARKWKEADRETANLMLKLVGRDEVGWLRNEDIKNFPCQGLGTIDALWVKYSNGHFGFSVQQRIWQEVGGKVNKVTECLLGDRVGWRVKSNWLPYDYDWLGYSNMTFSLNAPQGHLPARLVGIAPASLELLWGVGTGEGAVPLCLLHDFARPFNWVWCWAGVFLFSRVETCKL
jgi:hypothetical protein